MSNIGKTLLRGHALRDEGRVHYGADGLYVGGWPPPGATLHAACSCGLLSPPGISQTAAKRWHREHKDSLR